MMMNKALSALLVTLAMTGCAAPTISPDWTITERTPVWVRGSEKTAPAVGLHASAHALVPGRDIAVAKHCHSGATEEGRVVFRPGLGAHLRLSFWSTSTATAGGAAFPPLNLEMDLVLRVVHVPPDLGEEADPISLEKSAGQLSTSERVMLHTLLVTNRSDQGGEAAKKAANTVARYEGRLWNALVETLCVSLAENAETEPLRRFLIVEADLTHLCKQIPEPGDLKAFAQMFIARTATSCLSPAEEGGRHAVQRLIGGLKRDEPGSPASVAAGTALPLTGSFYSDRQLTKVAATGEIRMQQPRFGHPGTETWSLADWESSDICRDTRSGASGLRISAVNIKGSTFKIVGRDATHQVRRVLGGNYRFSLERLSNGTGSPTLARRDLAHLTPRDVSFTLWRVNRGGREVWSRPNCSRA